MPTPTNIFFTEEKSIYLTLNTNCFDLQKNALSVIDVLAAVYHPPCRSWGRLRHFARKVPGEHWLAVWSIIRIRKFGGILEHPAHSTLWKLMGLPLPGANPDRFGGFSLSIDQHWFGHQAKKNTFLYIVGCLPSQLPPVPISFDAITHVVSSTKIRANRINHQKEIPYKSRSSTPLKLALWLIEVATICESNKKNNTFMTGNNKVCLKIK